jgi:cytochrome c2
MSKFPKAALFVGAGAGIAATAGLAITLADRFVTPMPATAPTIAFQIPGGGAPAAEVIPAATEVAEQAVLAEPAVVPQAAAAASAPEAPVMKMAAAQGLTDSRLGLGRPALEAEIAAWDVDILPDGTGLPEGSGDVWTGEEVFAEQCAACHGDFAEGVGNWPTLAGGWDTLDRKDPVKTVGSYWPYLSTVWDYVHRSMPFGAAQTLSDDEVYAITAYILYSNDIVDEDFTLSHENFLEVEMPNAAGFIVDDRAEAEYAQWRAEPCMENCKDSVEITMRATVLDVTPDQAGAAEDPPAVEKATVEETEAVEEAEAVVPAALDAELVAAGERVFRKCKSCHQVGEGAKNRTGPALNGIVGHPAGAIDGFSYSKALKQAGEDGLIWTEEDLKAFLAKPRDYLQGTKMSFSGLRKEADQAAVVEYLKSFAEE